MPGPDRPDHEGEPSFPASSLSDVDELPFVVVAGLDRLPQSIQRDADIWQPLSLAIVLLWCSADDNIQLRRQMQNLEAVFWDAREHPGYEQLVKELRGLDREIAKRVHPRTAGDMSIYLREAAAHAWQRAQDEKDGEQERPPRRRRRS